MRRLLAIGPPRPDSARSDKPTGLISHEIQRVVAMLPRRNSGIQNMLRMDRAGNSPNSRKNSSGLSRQYSSRERSINLSSIFVEPVQGAAAPLRRLGTLQRRSRPSSSQVCRPLGPTCRVCQPRRLSPPIPSGSVRPRRSLRRVPSGRAEFNISRPRRCEGPVAPTARISNRSVSKGRLNRRRNEATPRRS